MRPKDLVNQLRRIASKIENSSRPSKELVSRDIRSVLAAMNEPTKTVDSKGTIEYRLNGKLHREDGPAVEWANDGNKYWYQNGKRHRTDGPAIEDADGTKEWYINGVLHRTDGPAIEDPNGHKEWWVNGKRHRTDGPAIEWANGNKYWYINGVIHRTDGPAVERTGNKEWYLNGKQITMESYDQFRSQYPELVDQFLAYEASKQD